MQKNKTVLRSLFFMLVLGLLLAPVAAQPDGWTQIDTDGICSGGTPYVFYVREGAGDDLMIYFQGGGACWNDQTCFEQPTFDSTVGENEVYPTGIFDFENPANPVADYDMVFIPYCTADIYSGDTSVEYSSGMIEHRGFSNTQTVLDWTYANYGSPASVFIIGSSAGSMGALFNAGYVMAHYDAVPVTLLGDGYAGVVPADWDGLATWGTYDNLPPDLVNADTPPDAFAETLYEGLAAAYPDNRLAQYSTTFDEVQAGFYALMGGSILRFATAIPQAMIAIDAPNFSYYLAPGSLHTILARPEFYETDVNEVSLSDWLAALLAGETVENVMP